MILLKLLYNKMLFINNKIYNIYPKMSKTLKTQQKTRSLSLPKLPSTQPSNPSNSPNPPSSSSHLAILHKPNWSLTPNCLLPSHQGHPILYICLHPACSLQTRLICEKCFYSTHKEHNRYCMAVDQVKNGRVGGLRYWPFGEGERGIFEFLRKNRMYVENLVLDVKASFQNLISNVIGALNLAKQGYLRRIQEFYQKNSRKSAYISNLTYSLEKCYNFKSIQNCVKQIFNKQVRHDVFMKKIGKVLSESGQVKHRGELERIRKQFYEKQNKQGDEKETQGSQSANNKGKDIIFDKIYFLKKQKTILKNISELQNSIAEKQVTIDQASIGIENLIVQTVQYLQKNSSNLLPLTYTELTLEDGTYYNGFISTSSSQNPNPSSTLSSSSSNLPSLSLSPSPSLAPKCKPYRTLLGLRDYRNGYKYYGQWKNNCRNGWGVYENKQIGYNYAGNWKQDKRNGYGKEISTVGVYEGNFLNDKKDGYGSMRGQDGVRFDIMWKNDKKHGKGKRIDANGQMEVYYLNGIQSQVKGASGGNGAAGEKRDVNFLARMFANGNGGNGK